MIVQMAFNASSGTSTVNINGGLLQTPAWTSGPNTTVNFNGGTLQANASSTNFLGGSPGAVKTVTINAGGATSTPRQITSPSFSRFPAPAA